MTSRVDEIKLRIEQALSPSLIDIYDDSQSHAGHAGARSGGGHFYATIVASAFEGKTLVRRHQMVYQALGELMRTDIHAFSIKAYTPVEYDQLAKQE